MSDNVPPPPPPPPGSGGPTPPPPPPPPPGDGPPAGGWGAPPPPPGAYGGPPSGPGGYSVGTAFSYAFDKFKANAGLLILLTLILLAGAIVMQLVGNAVTSGMTAPTIDPSTGQLRPGSAGFFGAAMITSLVFSAATYAVQLVIQSGVIKASLALTRGQQVTVGGAFNDINWAQVLLTAILTGIATFVGLLLCIIPGLIVIFLTSFSLYFVIDRQMEAIPAIKASIDLVKNNIGALLLFFLATIAAYIVGACLCGVGLLVAIPVVVLAQAYTFRTLTGDTVTS